MPEKRESIEEEDVIEILFINVTRLSKKQIFALSCTLVFFFYLIYGCLQELIYAEEGFKPFGWYLTLLQFIYLTIFAFTEFKLSFRERKIPLKTYFILAFLTVGTLGFSNSSLKYLNYPTQVIFKCCKLIPVMVGGIIIQKKKFSTIDYAASISMCLGLVAFILADSKASPNFHFLGVLMISCALICDAAIGNVQEKAMKYFKASNSEVIFYSSFIGSFYLLIGLLLNGDAINGFVFCSQKPHIYFYAFIFSACGYLGLQVVLTLVRTSGALTAVTVTNCRKAVSIILSFLFFKKPFVYQYIWAGFLIIVGIYLNIYSKNKVKIDRFINNLINQFRHNRNYHSYNRITHIV